MAPLLPAAFLMKTTVRLITKHWLDLKSHCYKKYSFSAMAIKPKLLKLWVLTGETSEKRLFNTNFIKKLIKPVVGNGSTN
jgi:hypothetical protein